MAPRALILGCAGPRLTRSEAAFFARADPWGFILFARNVSDPAQLARLTAELRAAVGRAAPILVDQEGGRVQRLRAPHWREWLPPLDQTARATDPVRAMFLRGRLIALELRAAGIDVNCAPLADIACAATHPFLHNRCYATTPDLVTRCARAMADGLTAGGVLPVLKHIPGHGRARADSHHDLPVVATDAATLAKTDFAPFRALADLSLGMTAHLLYRALDPDRPATLSPRIVTLIREEIGFAGLLMTDDISMQALPGSLPERATEALAAGCDIVLHCNGALAEMEALATVCPPLAGAALSRARAAEAARHTPQPADPAALAAEYDALLQPR